MAFNYKTVVALVFTALIFLGLLATFVGVSFSNPPKQEESSLTGFPVWHQTFKDEVKEITLAFTLLALVFTGVSAFAAHRATIYGFSHSAIVPYKGNTTVPSTQVNFFIKYYIYATLSAVTAYLIFDVGKVWAVLGAIHNLTEVALLVLLHSGGKVQSLRFGVFMLVYIVGTVILSVYLSWPMDAIFFKWQGLCSDYGLVIMFTRMYFETRKRLADFGSAEQHDSYIIHHRFAKGNGKDGKEKVSWGHPSRPITFTDRTSNLTQSFSSDSSDDETTNNSDQKQFPNVITIQGIPSNHPFNQPPIVNNNNEGIQGQEEDTAVDTSSSTEGSPVVKFATLTPPTKSPARPKKDVDPFFGTDEVTNLWGVRWTNPDQIIILIFAALFHVAGNTFTTIWTTSIAALAAFQISYGLAFPLYAYYLYVDYHSLRATNVYLPNLSKLNSTIYIILSIFFSTATLRAGLYVAGTNAINDVSPL